MLINVTVGGYYCTRKFAPHNIFLLHCISLYIKLCRYHDKTVDQHFRAHTVFQVFIQPGTYSVEVANSPTSATSPLNTQLEWHVSERTYIIHSLLVQLVP